MTTLLFHEQLWYFHSMVPFFPLENFFFRSFFFALVFFVSSYFVWFYFFLCVLVTEG